MNPRRIVTRTAIGIYRIGWPNTHIVTIEGYGVAGFTDGPTGQVMSQADFAREQGI